MTIFLYQTNPPPPPPKKKKNCGYPLDRKQKFFFSLALSVYPIQSIYTAPVGVTLGRRSQIIYVTKDVVT